MVEYSATRVQILNLRYRKNNSTHLFEFARNATKATWEYEVAGLINAARFDYLVIGDSWRLVVDWRILVSHPFEYGKTSVIPE